MFFFRKLKRRLVSAVWIGSPVSRVDWVKRLEVSSSEGLLDEGVSCCSGGLVVLSDFTSGMSYIDFPFIRSLSVEGINMVVEDGTI